MPTDEQLRAIMPALPVAKRQSLLPFLQQAIDEFDIAPPARQAAFLAQLAHESGQFRFMEEIWGPTAQQRRYEPVTDLAARLGNTQPGDGFRFKGRGPIQLTGRANYQRFGGLLGVDLIADPARAATPEVAFRIAALFWQRKGLNELADQAPPDAFREITRRINGGFNGLADRQKYYATALQALGVTPPAQDAPAATAGRRGLPSIPEFDRGYEAIVELTVADDEVMAEAPVRRAPKRATKRRVKKAPARKAARPAKRSAARRAPAKKTAKKSVRKTAGRAVRKPASRKKAAATKPMRRLAKKR